MTKQKTLIVRVVLAALLLSACGPSVTEDIAVEAKVQTTGFEPRSDGFGFENYGAANVTNLTPADLQRMFGDEVCASLDPTCILIPPARIWMESLNTAMEAGHCEGMAVLSQYFYFGVLKPQAFGSPIAAQLVLEGNIALQREIAYWWATQATYPTRAHHTVMDAVSAIAVLRAGMQPKANIDVLYTLGIYESKGKGGHTVTPIGLTERDATHVAIQIYDNNLPKTTQEIIVDTAKNSWEYTTTNEGVSTVLYKGDASSGTLDLTETSPRLEKQVCQFCPGNPLSKGIEELTTILFSSALPNAKDNTAAYSAYFEDSQGRRSGVVLGKSYNDIPGAQVHYLRGASGQWSRNGMPMIELPVTTHGAVYVTGSAEAPVTVSAFGAGSVVSVQNLAVDTTVASEVRLDQQRGTAAVASGSESSPDIVVGYSDGKKNVETRVNGIHMPKGTTAAVATNRATDRVDVLASEPQQVDIRVSVGTQDQKGPPRERSDRQPADAQKLAPLRDGMKPGPVIDTANPTREPGDNGGAPPTRGPGENGGPPPTRGPGENGGPPPTRGPGDNGGPPPTRGPGDNGGPPPTRGPGDNGGPPPTRGPGDNGGPPPTRGPGDNSEPPPTRRPGDNGEPPPTRGPGDNGGPPPTRGPGDNGGPPPTRGPGDNGGPPPTRGPGDNGGPPPTRGPGDNGGPPPTQEPGGGPKPTREP